MAMQAAPRGAPRPQLAWQQYWLPAQRFGPQAAPAGPSADTGASVAPPASCFAPPAPAPPPPPVEPPPPATPPVPVDPPTPRRAPAAAGEGSHRLAAAGPARAFDRGDHRAAVVRQWGDAA